MALNINGTTGISGVDASVSAPALTGTDSNTGISFPAADTIKFSTGGVERMSITNSGVTGAGGGKILQVKQALKTDAFSTTSTSYTDITGLSVNITPSSSSNKVLVDFIVACGNNTATHNRFELVRQVGGSDTAINPATMDSATAMFFVSESASNYMRAQVIYRFLDSPNTTSQVNYRLRTRIYSSSFTQYVNRAHYTTDTTGSSTITVMEVAA